MGLVTFVGDVFLPEAFDARGLGLDNIVLNLEAPVTASSTPHPGKINLRAPDWYVEETLGVKPLAVSLANNHIMDFGQQGLEDTLRVLNSAGIPYFGAGTLDDNCNNPAIVKVEETVLGLLGYVCSSTAPIFASGRAPGVAPIDLDTVRADVDRAVAMGAHRVIVCLHWGAEEVWLPHPDDVVLARRVVDLGVDAIIGHHAHVIQSWEVFRGSPIFYGLGNFIMPEFRVPARYTEEGVATSTFSALLGPWNRRSLAVTYDPASGDHRVVTASFDGNCVHLSNRHVHPEQNLDARFYHHRFRLGYLGAKLRRTLYSGAQKPRLPRWRHVKSLIRLLASRHLR